MPWRRARQPQGRAGNATAEVNRRYVEGQRIYLDRCRPHDLASVVIDNTEVERPRILGAVGES